MTSFEKWNSFVSEKTPKFLELKVYSQNIGVIEEENWKKILVKLIDFKKKIIIIPTFNLQTLTNF